MKKNTTLKLKSMLSIKLFSALLISSFLFGCEKQIDELEEIMKDKGKEQPDKDKDKDKDEVTLFAAEIHPLNNSGVTGTAVFKVAEDGKFFVQVDADDLVPNKMHPQHIHGFEPGANGETGDAECPPPAAAGEDGLISIKEGLPFYGPIIVPLDDELVPLASGEFPVASDEGTISYIEFVPLQTLTAAIEGMFPMKGELNLEKRSYVIHGAFVKNGEIVPPGTEGAEYIATLPVGCGEIKEIHDHNNGDGDEFNQ